MAITQRSQASPRMCFRADRQGKKEFKELTLSMTIQNGPLLVVKRSMRPLIIQQGINIVSAMLAREATAASIITRIK